MEELTKEVSGLRKAYENYRRFFIAVAILFVAVGLGFWWLWNVADNAKRAAAEAEQAAAAANQAVTAVKVNQTVNCQNANDTRGSQKLVWDFILDVSAADAGPGETAALESIRAWIHDVFANRDCADLKKIYKVPVPPNVKKLLEQVESETEQ